MNGDTRTVPEQLRDASAGLAREYPYDSGIAGGCIGLLRTTATHVEELELALRSLTETAVEFQDEQGGCNFQCTTSGRLHHEAHAPNCPLVLAQNLLAKIDAAAKRDAELVP